MPCLSCSVFCLCTGFHRDRILGRMAHGFAYERQACACLPGAACFLHGRRKTCAVHGVQGMRREAWHCMTGQIGRGMLCRVRCMGLAEFFPSVSMRSRGGVKEGIFLLRRVHSSEQAGALEPAQSLCMCARATNGRDRNAHRTKTGRLGKGCSKEHGRLPLCPKGCCCKRQHLPCCNARRAGSPFVLCFVLCAWQLLPLPSNGPEVKTVNRL